MMVTSVVQLIVILVQYCWSCERANHTLYFLAVDFICLLAIEWIQLGQDIDGESADDQSGYSVSLSDNGNILAIGALWNDGNGEWSVSH